MALIDEESLFRPRVRLEAIELQFGYRVYEYTGRLPQTPST